MSATIFGAVVGGAYRTTNAAQKKMTSVKPKVFKPIKKNVAVYAKLYKLYMQLHDALGGVNKSADLSGVMKELIEIRKEARR